MLAEHVLLGDDGILQDQLTSIGRSPSHFVFLLPCLYAPGFLQALSVSDTHFPGAIEVHSVLAYDERRNPIGALGRVRIRPSRHTEYFAHTGVRDEHFRSIENKMVALFLGERGCTAGIGARLRFGQAEPAQHLPCRQERHVLLFLGFGPEVDDR